jgi:hypothetical protein
MKSAIYGQATSMTNHTNTGDKTSHTDNVATASCTPCNRDLTHNLQQL